MSSPKVFGIGFHKTGTTSLGRALEYLGYRTAGPVAVQQKDLAEMMSDSIFDLVEQYDAFQDNPWPLLYKELDQRYPGSKFILTLRPTDQWIKSVLRSFSSQETPMRQWIYGAGCPAGNEALYKDRYERHNREVLEYFKVRPADLLVINLATEPGWDPLCAFLGKEIPKRPFPHTNKSRSISLPRRLWDKFNYQLSGRKILLETTINSPARSNDAPLARNVLLLSMSAGAGPVRAAQAVELALKELAPEWLVQSVDLFKLPGAERLKAFSDDEYRRVEQEPHLWGRAYDMLNRPPGENPVSFLGRMQSIRNRLRQHSAQRLLAPAFVETLMARPWDVVVSTAAMPSYWLDLMKQGGNLLAPYFIVNTDFMVHRTDFRPHCSHFFLSTANAASFLIALGMPARKISVTGIPVHPDFSQHLDRENCRRQFGLTADKPVILQLSGGFGMGSTGRVLRYLLQTRRPLQIVVSAGRNQALKEQLEQMDIPERHTVQILGFSEQMAQLLTAADLIITKPGGLISSEILASGAAAVVINPLPGPEQENRNFLLEQGAAIQIEHVEMLPYKISQLLENPDLLAGLRRNAAASGRPQAAFDIARFIIDWFNRGAAEAGN